MSRPEHASRKTSFAGHAIDTTLLRDEELKALRRLAALRADRWTLPEPEQARLRRLKWSWGLWTAAVAVAAVSIVLVTIPFGTQPGTVAFIVALMGAVQIGPMVAVGGPQIAESRAVKEATRSLRTRSVDDYLHEIGYAGRRAKPGAKQNGGRSDGGFRPYWHVDGYDHSRHRGLFSARDRANMNEWAMDADTYRNNVIEHDPD